MAGSSGSRRPRGSIVWLPSGSARVKVYGGIDPVTKRPLWLREMVKPRRTKRETEREANKVLVKLLNELDERRAPRTSATVNQLLDRWLDVLEVERTTRISYVGKIEKHIRPTIGQLAIAHLNAETVDSLYASLRRCRDHCGGRRFVAHRTTGEHVCDEHSARRNAPRSCSVIRPPTASGASERAARTSASRCPLRVFASSTRS